MKYCATSTELENMGDYDTLSEALAAFDMDGYSRPYLSLPKMDGEKLSGYLVRQQSFYSESKFTDVIAGAIAIVDSDE